MGISGLTENAHSIKVPILNQNTNSLTGLGVRMLDNIKVGK